MRAFDKEDRRNKKYKQDHLLVLDSLTCVFIILLYRLSSLWKLMPLRQARLENDSRPLISPTQSPSRAGGKPETGPDPAKPRGDEWDF